jgi:hypothetical protein
MSLRLGAAAALPRNEARAGFLRKARGEGGKCLIDRARLTIPVPRHAIAECKANDRLNVTGGDGRRLPAKRVDLDDFGQSLSEVSVAKPNGESCLHRFES